MQKNTTGIRITATSVIALLVVGGCTKGADEPPSPGARSAGDPLLTYIGNGGYDVSTYDVAYDFVPNKPTMASSVTIEARSLQALSEFSLDSATKSVTKVLVDGAPTDFRLEAEKLIVRPERALARGSDFRVTIDFVADRESMPRSPAGDTSSGLKPWINSPDGFALFGQPDRAHLFFPMNDTLQDKARMRFRITAPADLQVAANGRQTGRTEKEGRATTTFATRDEISTQFVQATVGRFAEFTGESQTGVPLRSLIDAKTGDRARPSTDLIDQQLTWLESETGTTYPFEVFGLLGVDADSANPAALETATLPIFSAPPLATPEKTPLVHEMAHQWFGVAVTPKTWADNWISEANASFYNFKYMDFAGIAKLSDKIAHAYRQEAEFRPEAGPAGAPKDVFAAMAQAYGGAVIMLYGLEKKLGPETFKRVQKSFFDRYRYKNASTQDYIDVANEISGQDLTGYIRSWLFDKTAPPMP